jgi:hypothetical protein
MSQLVAAPLKHKEIAAIKEAGSQDFGEPCKASGLHLIENFEFGLIQNAVPHNLQNHFLLGLVDGREIHFAHFVRFNQTLNMYFM